MKKSLSLKTLLLALTLFTRSESASYSWRGSSSSGPKWKDLCPAEEGLTYEMDVDLCYLLTLTYYAGWDTAEAACQHRDTRLAILDTDDKIDVVRSVILNNSVYHSPNGPDYFIGATLPRERWDVFGLNQSDYEEFYWTDGTPVDTDRWHPSQPNGVGEDHILALYFPTYLIYDRPSTRVYRAVCEKVMYGEY